MCIRDSIEIRHSGKIVTSKTDVTSTVYTTMKLGETKIVSLMPFVMIDDDGQYTIKVMLREEGNTRILDTATKDIRVG